MSKLIALFVAVTFLLAPMQVAASPFMLSVPGKVAPMQEGDTAPFTGTLFDVTAAAQILTDKTTSREQCELDKGEAIDKQAAKHALDMANLRAAKDAAERREKELVALKDSQVEFLSTQLELATAKPKRNLGPLWFASGVLGGILLMAVSAYAYKEING